MIRPTVFLVALLLTCRVAAQESDVEFENIADFAEADGEAAEQAMPAEASKTVRNIRNTWILTHCN